MLFENTIVGPIHSRRLGSSLGINLLPLRHKYCSYDCIYCECGWNKETEQETMVYASPEEIRSLLEKRLEQLRSEGKAVDSLTFAGNGEPTLYPQFAEMVDVVCEMRDRYFPKAVTTLLTNATQLKRPEIYDAIQRIDNAALKLDAGTAEMRQLINKNNDMGCSWDELIEGLVRVGGKAIIQTLLFDGVSNGQLVSNIVPEQFEPYLTILKQVQPRYVMLYALDRATPEKNLRKLDTNTLEIYAEKIRKEGIDVKVYG